MNKVGVLGSGAMGKGMIKNLIKAGKEVYVYDPFPKAQEAAKSLGAVILHSPKEVAEKVDLVLVSLPTSEAVEDAVMGENGALAGSKKGTVICDMSTADVGLEREIYKLCKAEGVGYLDCPVSGGPTGADNGTMSIMAGGDKDIFDKANEIFELIGKSIFYLGESGAGQTVKICHNMILAVTTLALTESFITGVKAGVSPATLSEIYKVSVARSGTLDLFGDNLVKGTYENTLFALSHMHKDAKLFMKLADDLKSPTPVSGLTYQLYNAAMNKGLGANDQSVVAKVLEEMADCKLAD